MQSESSPGLIRSWQQYPWVWDIDVSTVREAHECVSAPEKLTAKQNGAKLTYGEVLDCGVLQMLENLQAKKKHCFHDLGCGAGKLLIQSYLRFQNLKSCYGVELTPGRYRLAEQNVCCLVRSGCQNRKFIVVEHKSMSFLTIVEQVLSKPVFRVGDTVIAFNPQLRKRKDDVIDYTARIINKSGTNYSVQYSKGLVVHKLSQKFIFRAGSIRVLQINMGSLFDCPFAWDCDICVLETDFPNQTKSSLLEGIRKMPIGCTMLTYLDLRKVEAFSPKHIRQLSINVYDSDRYATTWSQGWRFYLWERTPAPDQALTKSQINYFNNSKYITYRKKNSLKDELSIGKITQVLNDSILISNDKVDLKLNFKSYEIFCPLFRYDVGDKVCCYWPENVEESVYVLFFGVIEGISAKGYTIRYQDGDVAQDIKSHWVFDYPKFLFDIDDLVTACWPMNAQNKKCPERYARFPARITGHNPDGTYQVQYAHGVTAENVREMWIGEIDESFQNEEKENISVPPDPSKVYSWDVDTVCRWVELLGLRCENIRKRNITGPKLFTISKEDLIKVFFFTEKEADILTNKIFRLKHPASYRNQKMKRNLHNISILPQNVRGVRR